MAERAAPAAKTKKPIRAKSKMFTIRRRRPMTKAELLEKANQIKQKAEELIERTSALRTDVGNSLQAAKRRESALIAARKKAEEERLEREKAERWQEYLNSDSQQGVYVSDRDGNFGDAPEGDANKGEAAEHAAAEQPAKQTEIEADKPKQDENRSDEGRAASDTASDAGTGSKPSPKADEPERAPAAEKKADEGERIRKVEIRPRDDRRGERKPGEGDRPRRDDGRQTDRQGDRRGERPQQSQSRDDAQRPQQRTQTGRKPEAASPIVPKKDTRTPEGKGTYVRTFDTEKKAKNKKTIMKESGPSARNWEDDGASYGSKKRKNAKHEQPARKPEPVVIEKAIITTETITVRDFSEKIGKPAAEILKKLFMMGIVANINQDIDYDTCALIAMDYEIELEQQLVKTYEEAMQETAEEADKAEDLQPRPPVVTIMGHVDHGKTSLLDAIRSSSVVEGEAGGITQHIGAYTVELNGRMITFIDTPGHEAFTSMRARGAQVTDVVILVVAADDGIMPQTIEAINHSKAAGVPIIVAVNKIDKPEANPARVKQQLMEHELVCEEFGGDTICVEVSAKKRMNLDNLLEMVLLQADVLELKANPNRDARGTIIEAQLDRGRGPVATVLVQNGTLKVGDPIVAGIAYGRVRAMMDDKGRSVKSAGPSCPVEVLGFNEVPSAGDVMNVAEVSKKVAEERRNKIKAEQLKNLSKVSLEDLFSHIAEGEIKTLNIVVKADVAGSVEAVKASLEKLSNEEVRVKCIHGGVGAISESDIMFASASNAIVIGFNVRPDAGARALAEQEKVDVRTYRIIYQAIEDVENAMKGLFKPVFKEVHLGTISVRNTFKVSSIGTIAGAYVQEGRVTRNALVRVVRDGVVIHEGKIASLRRFKDDVKEVATGYECGISIEDFNDIHEQDQIEAYIMEEVKR
ncbi:MAG: translation initiation factor IF-2 [Clostridia bacterium]|nr:translation initiation factor IF-2 [Clostridia bacterium]